MAWRISSIVDAHQEALEMLRAGHSYVEEIERELRCEAEQPVALICLESRSGDAAD